MTENVTESADAEYQTNAMTRALVEAEKVRMAIFQAHRVVGEMPLGRLTPDQARGVYRLWENLCRLNSDPEFTELVAHLLRLAEEAAGLGAKAPEEVTA